MNNTDFKYDLLFELSPDLLCIAGYDGYFKKINPAVSNLLGYTLEELYARPINDFVYQEDKDKTAHVRKELTEAKPLLNFENRYLTKDGEIVWLSWTSLPVESDQLIFAIAKDITHKKKQEEERNELLANLTSVNKDLKQLNYTASHDFRSPINNLLAIIELIDATRFSNDETVELIEVLKLAGKNLKETLDNYVDALSEKYSVYANVEEVDLQETLSKVLKSISSLVQSSKATITSDFSNVTTINFNRIYLESVFLNLITNAIKYAKPGCPAEISINSERRDGRNLLIIEDNGLGFDMEKVKDKIFGLHQKFHNHSDSKGIGLYLVHSHVTSLGGQISVESKINEGTKFTISFK